jgi:predicted ATPase/DNA-binding SARP family transcriptional activator
MAHLELCLLGAFQVRLDGAEITGFESNKVRALLAILAAEAPRPRPRESLAELLWPGWPQQAAMSNLRYALSDLRKTIGDRGAKPPFLLVTRERIQWNPECGGWVDVHLLNQAVTSSEPGALENLRTAVELYRGPFLEGFSLAECAEFNEWLLGKRAYYQQHVLQVLQRLAEEYEKRGDYPSGLLYARRALEIELWLEEGHRQVMRLLALSGQRSVALAQYEECKRLLERELGTGPSVETRQLYERIRDETFYGKESRVKETALQGKNQVRRSNNLPVQLTSFIGREKEIGEVGKLLHTSHLVTLCGAGGVGKTRLALQLGRNLLDTFPHGVWLVELAALTNPGLVPLAVLQALGLKESPENSALEMLSDYLSDKRLLLILDNCEHLVTACAELANELLRDCAELRILATSRELLSVSGEVAYRVPSLSIPEREEQPDLQKAASFEAVALFVERAKETLPDFVLTEANIGDVAEICRRLDGIPLAIELAASRVRLLSVKQIADLLDNAFRLLKGGSRTAPPRQQTLRATIDWSYTLLSDEEQALLRALSVFSGGWDLEAAEGVCAAILNDPQVDVLHGLGQLVDKSLVLVSGNETRRYRMLETIRQYAQEKLSERGEADQTRQSHLVYFLSLAEQVEPEFDGSNLIARLNQFEAELGNLRAALEWGLHNNLEAELRLASALGVFFNNHARLREGADWLDQGLARAEGSDLNPEVRAHALVVVGGHLSLLGDKERAEALLLKSLQIYREIGTCSRAGEASALSELGGSISDKDPQRAVIYYRQALEFYREIGDLPKVATNLFRVGADLWKIEPGNSESRPLLQEALDIFLKTSNPGGVALIYHHFAKFDKDELNFESAFAWWEKCLPIFRQIGDQDMICYIYLFLGDIARYKGDWPSAISYFKNAIEDEDRLMSSQIIQIRAFIFLGEIGMTLNDLGMARDYFQKAIIFAQRISQNWIGIARFNLGMLAWEQGEGDRAQAECVQALKLMEDLKDFINLPIARVRYSKRMAACGEKMVAETLLKENLSALGKNKTVVGLTIEGLACLAARTQPERAARLFGSAEQINPYLANQLFPIERAECEAALASVRAALGKERLAFLWAEGRALTFEQALDYARASK